MAALIVNRSLLNTLGSDFDLTAEVAKFDQLVQEHSQTVNVPAPQHPEPLVERIVYNHGGEFQINEDG